MGLAFIELVVIGKCDSGEFEDGCFIDSSRHQQLDFRAAAVAVNYRGVGCEPSRSYRARKRSGTDARSGAGGVAVIFCDLPKGRFGPA